MQLTHVISDTAVANFAAGVLDEASLLAIDDTSSLGRFMQREYTYARDELLQTYPWAFAKTRKLVAPLTEAPAFGWTTQYRAPDDCLRPLPITIDGLESSPAIPYEYESYKILCNHTGPLRLRYIRRVTSAAEFTPLFARALGNKLAMMAATRITGKGTYLEKATQMYMASLTEARLEDSLSRGTPSHYHADLAAYGANSNGYSAIDVRSME